MKKTVVICLTTVISIGIISNACITILDKTPKEPVKIEQTTEKKNAISDELLKTSNACCCCSATIEIKAEETTTLDNINNHETLAQKNAIKKAKNYVNLMGFSREELIAQLESDGFEHNTAVYGVDNCNANWNEEAVEKANTYLDLMAFSKEELTNQLSFDKFTDNEIEYAMNVIGY